MTDPTTQRRIVLASGSPRRRQLLEHVGFEPVVHRSDVPETPEPGEAPDAYTARLARQKASDVAARLDDAAPRFVLAADTVVVFEDDILEKPSSDDHAVSMLTSLSDAWHTVVTSFCWLDRQSDSVGARTVATDVQFRPVTEEWIRRYVATGEPMDKAGAYGIQDIGGALVRQVRGSYSAVVGLPVCQVIETLESMGGLHDFPFEPQR